jgi:transketolase
MNKDTSMRDAFFSKLYDLAKNDRDIMVVSGDMGAPALDKFRRDYGNRFINIGIAEHNMIAVAAGLAREGKKVYTYAIAPFISSRCYEFSKVDASLMRIPIKLVGVGAGFGYDDSGPTHHTTEDISIMRVLPNFEVFSPADSVIAAKCA